MADRLSGLSPIAIQACQERTRLAGEVAASRARLDKQGVSDLTDAELRQREANIMDLQVNDETRSVLLGILAGQRQELDLFGSLVTRHAEAVASKQAIMCEQSAIQLAPEACHTALATAVEALGAWHQTLSATAVPPPSPRQEGPS
jgi:hypothetical protein